jgi:hypothetical protein
MPVSTRADDQGRFRFDGLAPGGWQLRANETWNEISMTHAGNTRYVRGYAPPIEWDCQVSPSRACIHDIVLSARCRFELQLGPSFTEGTWTPSVSLNCANRDGGAIPTISLQADAAGWHADLECSGKARLQVSGHRDEVAWNYRLPLDLTAGTNVMRLDIPTGSLKGRLRQASPGTGLSLQWDRASDGASASVTIALGKDGSFMLDHVPAGACSLKKVDGQAVSHFEIEMAAGEVLDLPDF